MTDVLVGSVKVKLAQDLEELRQLCEIAKKCTSFLEIGSRYGGSFYEITRAMPKGSRAISVDLPNGPWGRDNSRKKLKQVVAQLQAEGYKAKVIFGDSTSRFIQEKVKSYAPFDLVFIDANHTYAGVSGDWDIYGPMGKIVAFHDIVSIQPSVDVPLFWKTLTANTEYRYSEFVTQTPGCGIGVIYRV